MQTAVHARQPVVMGTSCCSNKQVCNMKTYVIEQSSDVKCRTYWACCSDPSEDLKINDREVV